MTADATVAGPTERTPDRPAAAVRYLVLLPSLQLAVAPTARLASEFLGPSHPVTAGLALGLLYGTLATGPLALLGLALDGRLRRRRESGGEARGNADGAADAPRWKRYVAAALALAALLAHHLTLGHALAGLLEPALSVAVAMVPVGLAYHYRRWKARSARRLARRGQRR